MKLHGKVFMAKKGNRFLSILSIVVLFSIIAVLYVVPAVVAVKHGSVIAIVEEPTIVESDFIGEVEIVNETPAEEPVVVVKEEGIPTDELCIEREWIIAGNHFNIEAYDGYGFISYPATLPDTLIEQSISEIYSMLPDSFAEIKYALSDGMINLSYNQGYTENDINSLIDVFESIFANWINIPSKPSVYIEDQSIISNEFELTSTLDAMGTSIDVYATNGYARFRYPASAVFQSDVANALVQLSSLVEEYHVKFDATLIDGETELYFSEDYTKADVETALQFIQSYLDSIRPAVIVKEPVEEEVPAIKVPSLPKLSIELQELVSEPLFSYIHKEFSVLGENAYVDAYPTNAIFVLGDKVSEQMLLSHIDAAFGLYGDFLKGFDFALEGNSFELLYGNSYTENEMNSFLDQAIAYLSTIKPATPVIEEPVVEIVEPMHVSRDLYVLSLQLKADAYDGYATIAYPEYIADEDIANAIVLLNSEFSSYINGFEFAIGNGIIDITYPMGYTESDINYAFDHLQLFLDSFKIPEPQEEVVIEEPVRVPEKPEFIVNHIKREMSLLGSVVYVDAYDGHAQFILPEFVTEDDIANGLVVLYETFGDEIRDFDFAIDGNMLNATYSNDYTENEINSLLDELEIFLATFKPIVIKVPSKPSMSVASELEPIHIVRDMTLFGKDIKVDAYDGYAVFTIPDEVNDQRIADAIVSLVSSTYPSLSDFDFAISEDLEATFNEGYSYQEIEALLDLIENYLLILKPPVPSVPRMTLSSELVEDITHVAREFDVYGVTVEANAYDGYATFEYSGIDENIVADALVSLYASYPEIMKDIDFALSYNKAEASYSFGYTEGELASFLDAIENSFSSKKN